MITAPPLQARADPSAASAGENSGGGGGTAAHREEEGNKPLKGHFPKVLCVAEGFFFTPPPSTPVAHNRKVQG